MQCPYLSELPDSKTEPDIVFRADSIEPDIGPPEVKLEMGQCGGWVGAPLHILSRL